MTEKQARLYIRAAFGVSRETLCAQFAALVIDENQRQNLIAPITIPTIWTRHIADSAQLVDLIGNAPSSWFDIGSGAGFPGVIVAALGGHRVTLVEPRRKRADFLRRSAEQLGLEVEIVCARAQSVVGSADVISARAVASLTNIFTMASHLASIDTIWVLPRGKSAYRELEITKDSWQCDFHVERSVTDSDSFIVVARNVRRA